MGSRVLVTGGAGFLGSHLCQALLEKEYEVLCVDNFFTGSKRNVRHMMKDPNFELIRHDIVHPIHLEVDRIFNMACPASPIHYQYNPVKTIKMGTVAVVNMLGLAKRCNARILQASTSEVYGDPMVHPQTEDYWGHVNPIGPRSCYDEGKRVAESLMMAYRLQHGTDIRIARIFNTYGPNMSIGDGRVVSNFIVQALREDPMTVYGDGSQTRSFCFVSDLIDGLMGLMDKEDQIEPVNLGNPRESTILEIAQLIQEMTGTRSEIVFKELPTDDPVQRCPDITRARKVLQWEPKVPLEEGLKATIDYFRELV